MGELFISQKFLIKCIKVETFKLNFCNRNKTLEPRFFEATSIYDNFQVLERHCQLALRKLLKVSSATITSIFFSDNEAKSHIS